MYGAILGDIIGSPFEFDRGNKTKEFPLFSKKSKFTDDSVMTIAVAEALMEVGEKADEETTCRQLIKSMKKWGQKYPNAGYGARFYHWVLSNDPKPYGSFGNGSAMRVSSAGWFYDTLERTLEVAEWTAKVTHNHPEGIKGAKATAGIIFLARNGATKEEIRKFAEEEIGYDLSRTCDEIRPGYHHDESCQKTVPEAITAFLESQSYEDAIRTAISLGGDTDTLACICGAMAEAFYGVPEELKTECEKRVRKGMLDVLKRFVDTLAEKMPPYEDPFLEGNEVIDKAIELFSADGSEDHLRMVLDAIRLRMHADGHFIIPVEYDETDNTRFALRTIQSKDGKLWNAAFTSHAEYEKGAPSQLLSHFIDSTLKGCLESETNGFIINPWGRAFLLTKELITKIFEADEGIEYTVPDDPITTELLEDGSFLKRAIEICNRNRTQLNLFKVARILRDSFVWIPCTAVLSDADYEVVEKAVKEAMDGDGLDSLVGQEFTNNDEVRLIPDILQHGDEFFFPVFSTSEEMGEYGNGFSKIEKHFLEAVQLAGNNEKDVAGIVINAFSEPFVIPREAFDSITEMDSGLEEQDGI